MNDQLYALGRTNQTTFPQTFKIRAAIKYQHKGGKFAEIVVVEEILNVLKA
jgi:hypothetical protein